MTVPSSQGPDTLPSIPRFDATTPPPPLGVVRSQMIAGPDMSSRAAKSLLLGLRRQLVVQAAVFGGFGVLLVVFGAFMAADDSSSSVLIYGCALLVLTPALPFFAYRRIIAVWARFAPAGTPMSSEFLARSPHPDGGPDDELSACVGDHRSRTPRDHVRGEDPPVRDTSHGLPRRTRAARSRRRPARALRDVIGGAGQFAAFLRSSNLSTLPVDVRGNSSAKMMSRGIL